MSFGFSVGDFIAGANLAYQLLRTLSDSQGSSKEYQEVIQELGCVQQTFLHVEQMYSCNLFSKATLNAISYIITSSVEVMSNFFARTEKYRQSLSGNGGGYMDSWRKVGWSLFKKEELAGLRDTLQTRLTAISILVSTASHQNQFMIPKEVARFQTSSFEYQTPRPPTSDSSSATTVVGENGLQELTRDTMKVDGSNQTYKQQDDGPLENAKERDELNAEPILLDEAIARRQLAEQDAIKALTALKLLPLPPEPEKKPPKKKKLLKFKDAVGRKFNFPFHLCATWQGMEELIRQAFLHVEIIGPHVAEGHYDLIGPNGDIILPQVWETVVEPDWTVTMHMWPIPEKPSTPEPVPEPPVETRPKVPLGRKHFNTLKFANWSRRSRYEDSKG